LLKKTKKGKYFMPVLAGQIANFFQIIRLPKKGVLYVIAIY